MRNTKTKMAMTLCMGVLATQLAWSQPDPNVAPKGDNPPERVRGKGGNPGERGRGNGDNRQEFQDRMAQRMREMLTHIGVNDQVTQDAVVDFVRADTQARRPLREQSAMLFRALNNGGVTDDQLLALVTDLHAAQDAEAARREKAQVDLDAKIHYKQNPRLEAVLLLSGLIGDGQNVMMTFAPRDGGERGMQGQRGDDTQRREQMKQKMLQRFDKNNDGKLDANEEAEMQQWRQQRQNGPAGGPPRGPGNPNNNDAPPPPPGGNMPNE